MVWEEQVGGEEAAARWLGWTEKSPLVIFMGLHGPKGLIFGDGAQADLNEQGETRSCTHLAFGPVISSLATVQMKVL